MAVELIVPAVGESISEVMISEWLRTEGEGLAVDDSVAELESDKATVELPSPVNGVLVRIIKGKGEMAAVGEVIALIEEGDAPVVTKTPEPAADDAVPEAATEKAPAAAAKPAGKTEGNGGFVMPAAKRAAAVKAIDPTAVAGTGPGGRVLKEDVLGYDPDSPAQVAAFTPEQIDVAMPDGSGSREEELVPMSPMRKTIAGRLVESQQQAALLTTFNEVDMSEIVMLRKEHQADFTARFGIKLGFMSFFVKATIDALKQFPQVNAEIRGTDVVYKNYYDISIAVSGGKGLVTPVIRNAERLSFAQTEHVIADFAERAHKNKLDLDELKGGTFTISNGGVFGSMMSTPIVNPPQVAVLGMHAIEERPVVRDSQIVIRPMMYVAMTYDHRIIDGRESVTFLKRIKDAIEEPSRMLLEV